MASESEAGEVVIAQVEHVGHADRVVNSGTTNEAGVVGHADRVEHVDIHGEPLRTPSVRRLKYIRDIAASFTVLFALVVMVLVIVDKNANENGLRDQLNSLQAQRSASDRVTADKLVCVRRYQDIIDANTENQLVLIGEFLVIITQIPPGDERAAAVAAKIKELDQVNVASRKASKDKIDYVNGGQKLPCPIGKSQPPPPGTAGG